MFLPRIFQIIEVTGKPYRFAQVMEASLLDQRFKVRPLPIGNKVDTDDVSFADHVSRLSEPAEIAAAIGLAESEPFRSGRMVISLMDGRCRGRCAHCREATIHHLIPVRTRLRVTRPEPCCTAKACGEKLAAAY